MRFKDDAIKPGMVIHCPTEKNAMMLLEHLASLGYYWINGHSLRKRTQYEDYKDKTCYTLNGQYGDFKSVVYSKLDDESGEVTEFSDLIEPDSDVVPKMEWTIDLKNGCFEGKPVSDSPMSAVEVLEWIYDNSGTQIMRKVFGLDREGDVIDDSTILDVYSPEQIVDKITAYEAAKKEKPAEVEWKTYCILYHIMTGDVVDYVTERKVSDEAEAEELLRQYSAEHEGEYYVSIEKRCYIKDFTDENS